MVRMSSLKPGHPEYDRGGKVNGTGLSSIPVKKARNVSRHWNRSVQFQEALSNRQEENYPQISPYVQTRWYSFSTMIGSLIKNQGPLSSIMDMIPKAEDRLGDIGFSLSRFATTRKGDRNNRSGQEPYITSCNAGCGIIWRGLNSDASDHTTVAQIKIGSHGCNTQLHLPI